MTVGNTVECDAASPAGARHGLVRRELSITDVSLAANVGSVVFTTRPLR